jgi:hypothetical protein
MRRALLFSITVMLCLGLLPLGACGRVATATPVAWRPASTAAPTATGTAAPTLAFTPEPTLSATDTETPAATREPCTFVLLDDITAPHEPRHGDVYAEALLAGATDEAVARTTDDWVGFEPGIPQALNVGIFRLLWLDPAAPVDYTGGCDQLPIVTYPFEPLCAAVPFYDSTALIYAGPGTGFEPIAELATFGWIEIVDWPLSDWWLVDLANSSLGASGTGWLPVESADWMPHSCRDLNEPDPNACLAYVDSQMEVPVYASPSLDAEQVQALRAGGFARVLPSQEAGWLYVDLVPGNGGLHLAGWVDKRNVGLYGACP